MITSKKINTEKYAEKRNIPSLFYKMEDGKIIYKQQVENRTEKKKWKKMELLNVLMDAPRKIWNTSESSNQRDANHDFKT